jgi:hypothetical protein
MIPGHFFNGIECVRFDKETKRAYVSVGFNTRNRIYLKFTNVETVTFISVARYYDDRNAAYTISIDNWGRLASANPGAPWKGMENDDSDKYQASLHACRMYNIPCSIAINSALAGGPEMWERMREELGYLGFADSSWEPAVHTRTHPWNHELYMTHGYEWEILGCRDDILINLADIPHGNSDIPYGNFVFEFILPAGFHNSILEETCAGEFLFLRGWSSGHHPESNDFASWNSEYGYYGIGGLHTADYDQVFCARSPKGRYYISDVTFLNNAFDAVYTIGGIFYGILHPEYYENSVIFDTGEGIEGISGSSFMYHLNYVANIPTVWYVANGWMYSYRYVAENALVSECESDTLYQRFR